MRVEDIGLLVETIQEYTRGEGRGTRDLTSFLHLMLNIVSVMCTYLQRYNA